VDGSGGDYGGVARGFQYIQKSKIRSDALIILRFD
jgi:hypothetical protein